jgi:hypothetical protein
MLEDNGRRLGQIDVAATTQSHKGAIVVALGGLNAVGNSIDGGFGNATVKYLPGNASLIKRRRDSIGQPGVY